MKKEVVKNLEKYLNEHLKMQLFCLNLSKNASQLGFPGFKHWFQVQAQDEFYTKEELLIS